MAEDEKSKERVSVRASVVSEFLGSLWGKILAILTAITLVLGIYVEGISAWRATNEAVIAASNVHITGSNLEKSREEAASAHAQSCEAQFRVAFGKLSTEFESPPSVMLEMNSSLMETIGIRRLVRECREYFTEAEIAAVAAIEAKVKYDEEHKQQRAEAAALGYNDDGSKSRVQEDVTLKSFGLQRTGADDEDKRLICIAETAWAMVEERHIQREAALTMARSPSSESDVTYCVEFNRRREQLGAIHPDQPVSVLNPPLRRINELAAQAVDPDEKVRHKAARAICSDTAIAMKIGKIVGCNLN